MTYLGNKLKCVAGIDTDKDSTFISLAVLENDNLSFLDEVSLPLVYQDKPFITHIKDSINYLDQKLQEKELEMSVKIKEIFLNLPWELTMQRKVEGVIDLKKRKKINFADIAYAKKSLAQMALNFDDYCIHNFVINYEVDGLLYPNIPLGVDGKKIKLTALLVWVKTSFYKEMQDVFLSVDRKITSLVFTAASALASSFSSETINNPIYIVNIGYSSGYIISYKEREFNLVKRFEFSLSKIIEEISKAFAIPLTLAQEVFAWYITFKDEYPADKEVILKNESSYIKISMLNLNNFTRDYLKSEINKILIDIHDNRAPIIFIGRLNNKEGVSSFFKTISNYMITEPLIKKSNSLSFGCVRYGVSRYLEDMRNIKIPFWQMLANLYTEYF